MSESRTNKENEFCCDRMDAIEMCNGENVRMQFRADADVLGVVIPFAALMDALSRMAVFYLENAPVKW